MLVVALGAAVLAGCSGDKAAVDKKDIRSVFAAFTAAGNAEDWPTMCSFASSRARAELEKAKPRGCVAYYRWLSNKYGTTRKTHVRIESLEVDGRTAVLGDSTGETTYFRKEGGDWLIDRAEHVGTSETATARKVRLMAGGQKKVKGVRCKEGAKVYRCDVEFKSGKCEGWVYAIEPGNERRVWHADARACGDF
jgi:hypothetical protein